MSNDVLEELKQHLNNVPYEIDKKYFLIAIREIERLNAIVAQYSDQYPYNDQMLKRLN